MKIFHKVSMMAILAIALSVSLSGPITTFAAVTAPNLGAAASYAVFGKAGVTNDGSATTHIWGNVGADAANVTGLIAGQVSGIIDAGVGIEAAILTAYGQLAAQGSPTPLSLAGNNTVTPWLYTVGATTLNGTLTLDGTGVYIFRSDSSISTSGPAVVSLINGADACNVFWQIPTSMTIGAGSQIVGTIITNTALISLADGASLKGRALSRNTQVTLIKNQITEPVCNAVVAPITTTVAGGGGPSVGGSGPIFATLNVIKLVVNEYSVLPIPANKFTLNVKKSGIDVAGSPAAGTGVPGTSYFLPAGTYVVSEKMNTSYKQSLTGDCDASGSVTLFLGDTKTCTVTNTRIAPSIIPVDIVNPRDTVGPVTVIQKTTTNSGVLSTKELAPHFPNAGLSPGENDASWNTAIFASILMFFSISLIVVIRKRLI